MNTPNNYEGKPMPTQKAILIILLAALAMRLACVAVLYLVPR